MICANILIYYLLVTCCCCCGQLLQLVSAASQAAPASAPAPAPAALAPAAISITTNVNNQQQQRRQQEEAYLSNYNNHDRENPSKRPIAAAIAEEQQQQHLPKAEAQAEAANKHVHKLMSEKDLRRTFQVDSHDQVPEYEVLKLQVNQDGSHLISPISDLGELLAQQSSPFASSSQLANENNEDVEDNDDDDDVDDVQAAAHSTRLKREAISGRPQIITKTSDRTSSNQANNNQNNNDDDENLNLKNNDNNNNKLIVIDLSTFGKDFKLRLKRNADFQQRIKDMKMFTAESTQDGKLKYTEVSHSFNGKTHKQEQHKRAANADDESFGALEAAELSAGSLVSSSSGSREDAGDKKQAPTKDNNNNNNISKSASGWNIGSTYHDEDNLAALLIDHDKKTGQLQIEGTIGNDFVIKPMPKATMEALLSARRQQQASISELDKKAEQQLAATTESNSTTSRLDKSASPSSSTIQDSNNTSGSGVGQQQQQQQQRTTTTTTTSGSGGGLDKAIHMHDDDPHDDDEMFLDEDEAIELAQLQLTATNRTMLLGGGGGGGGSDGDPHHHNYNYSMIAGTNQTSTTSNLPPHPPSYHHHYHANATRILSKAASERKWNKYRKLLLAQTQVPKIHQQQTVPEQSSSSQRARRHAAANPATGGGDNQRQPVVSTISHHIVFRQKPSSEESSSEHQHSFMISPGSSMERLAFSFQPRREKRAATDSSSPAEVELGSQSRLMMIDDNQEADSEQDPLGGQFYLEPASLTGFERAGHNDWSFQVNRAPYSAVFNSTTSSASNSNTTTAKHLPRFKRHTRPAMMARGSSQVRRKRQAPDTVWPEVLLVVDYDSFLLHGGDSRDVKRYFVSFWNGVDLRYKLLVHPHIRISLAGMIVAKDRDATPYLERNRLRAPNADAVDAAGALTDMGKYLYREDRLPTYDLAVVITKLDMCRRRFEGGRCNRGTAGFAYVGGACVVNKRLEKVNSVAIIEDSGGFSGIIVAAHEVGHLLGCVHDGSPPPSYLGGPGATHCPWEDGFIMSDLRHTERGFRWSQCSVEQFKHFLNGETATCLYNYPHESQMLHRLLPGTMLSLDEQCKRDRGTNACFKDARVCAQLFCFDSASGYCVSYRPAAEGSPCGEGQVCRNGKCVGEIENIIPDYTHQSQTVVARGRPAPATAGSAHGLARLADNGLSASSTSTATSSPDNKAIAPVGSNGGAGGAATASVGGTASQPPAASISSRMDTFPIDSPLIGSISQPHYSSSGYSNQFGGRYGTTSATSLGESMTSSSAGVVMSRQRHPGLQGSGGGGSALAQARSSKLIAEPGTRHKGPSEYQQRSGLQAPSSQAFINNQKSNRSLQYQQQQQQKTKAPSKQSTSGGGQLRTSASTITRSQQYQSPQTTPTSSSSSTISKIDNINNNNNNLLAISHNQFINQPSTSSIQAANSNSKQRTTAAAYQSAPRLSAQTHAGHHHQHHVNNDNINNNNNFNDRNQQFTNVNQQQTRPYESLRSGGSSSGSTNSKAIYGSPAIYMTSPSSHYQTMLLAAA